ncbi:hypothetical protein K7432_009647 [Basidiobolus ranarum]|uniref:Mitochondrial carrier n=1 Tax=Basidiobolus ranarum TaxID=34480 RepID=A0ABR2WPY5_9FUNG
MNMPKSHVITPDFTQVNFNNEYEQSLNFQPKDTTIVNGLTEQGWAYLWHMLFYPISIGGTLLEVQYVPRDTLEKTDEAKYDRPVYQLAPLDTHIFGMFKALISQPTESWFSLWKGQFNSRLHQVCLELLQATLEGIIHAGFNVSVPISHVVTKMASQVTSRLLLTPLEMANTRLMVQTSFADKPKYKGLIHCLRTIIAEEGFGALYQLPILLSTVIIESMSAIDWETIFESQYAHGKKPTKLFWTGFLSYLALSCIVAHPMGTIRSRLQCQITTTAARKNFKTVVRTCQVPYAGIWDCGRRILTEESHKKGNSLNWQGLWINIGLPVNILLWGFALGFPMCHQGYYKYYGLDRVQL